MQDEHLSRVSDPTGEAGDIAPSDGTRQANRPEVEVETFGQDSEASTELAPLIEHYAEVSESERVTEAVTGSFPPAGDDRWASFAGFEE